MLRIIFLIFAYFTKIALAANILVVGMPNGKSHISSMLPLLRELAQIFRDASKSCDYVIREHADEYQRIASYPWDLILTDSLFAVCGYGLASLSKAHHVIMHTSSMEGFYALAKALGRQHAAAPPFFMDSWHSEFHVDHFFDRLNAIKEIITSWLMWNTFINYYTKRSLASIAPNFDFSVYSRTNSMSFTDMPLKFYVSEPISNELFSYGCYCNSFNELQGELVDFVNDPKSKGTILMAFGTILRLGNAPVNKLEAYVKALNNLTNYNIIWGCTDCPPMKLEKHVRVMPWVPQIDILHHPKTKLFITHGGLKSVKEAICAAMPTLFMPVFAEQVRNAWLAKQHGFGQIINRFNLTDNYLLELITEMLNNSPSYVKQARELSFTDMPISPLKEASFRISHLIKYGGRFPEYFYIRAANFGYIKYLNLDFILIIPAVILFVLTCK
ncbi:unnamed protein product [Thelazia callipaeda]|uniref:UDP-glucuronosyltransferase n=1 Tax=Thelazia callipaeda TaxID=103827 RepID=A0A158RCQ0_THECL|nr:unnamed protein product [Thelazia callipaeda]